MSTLNGIKIIELAGIGPAPMCAMLLADMGAEVVRIDRRSASGLGIEMPARFNLFCRGRRSIALDLKRPEAVEVVLRLVEQADVLLEGFRPGVTERLGLGPDACLARNPRLVYGRVTGWGQQGPLAQAAGHDLNYIALTGVLHSVGRRGAPPTPPLNLVADYGGGALYLALGILAALLETSRSGRGQVVDAAMIDGALSLMTGLYGLLAADLWSEHRGENLLDSGAPMYEVYETRDGRYVSLAPIEPKFYAELSQRLGLPSDLPDVADPAHWPTVKAAIATVIAGKSAAEWQAELEGTDVCFAPVLRPSEAPMHPHHQARDSFVCVDGVTQPAPAPRFSRTPSKTPNPPVAPGADTAAALTDWGFSAEEVAALVAAEVAGPEAEVAGPEAEVAGPAD